MTWPTRDGTGKTVSRHQLFRLAQIGTRKSFFPVQVTSSRVGKPIRPIHTTLAYLIATLSYIQTYRPNKTQQVLLLFSARTTQILLFRMHSLCPCSCIYYTAHNRAVRPRHAILLHYSNMSCRKDQREGSPKQAGSSWSARYCWLATSGGNLYPPGVWFADAMSSFSATAVTLVLFRLHLYAFIEGAAFRWIVLRYAGASTATRISSFFPFVSFRVDAFSEYFRTIAVFSLYGEYVVPTLVRFFLPDGVFLSCDHRLYFYTSA